MPSELLKIKDFAETLIEATSVLIDLDLYIVDSSLYRIAATGAFKRLVGLSLPKGCANDFVLHSKSLLVLDDPTENDICRTCSVLTLGKCLKEHMIIFPIVSEDRCIGTIAFNALSDVQKSRMRDLREQIIAFASKLSDAILGKIVERRTTDRFLTVINSIDEGIVLVDEKGGILHSSRVMQPFLAGVPRIQAILPEGIFQDILKQPEQFAEVDREVDLIQHGSPVSMFMRIKSIASIEGYSELLFTFRKRSELGSVAYSLLADASHLDFNFESILGGSPCMLRTKSLARQAAEFDSNVLLLGESGTGKELFARSIHAGGPRSKKPFIAINCAAIPESLLESELFGYEGGAFTDAKKTGKPGKFELANGGTVFLDEIGDLSLHLQPKLLRVIEYGKLERIGGVRSIDLDVRIITATNRNIDDLVAQGAFREDLYYRLCVVPITIPPLRRRTEDILLLAHSFLSKYNLKFKKDINDIDENTKRELLAYGWPGNVRELENAIEYAVNFENSDTLRSECLPERIRSRKSTNPNLSISVNRKTCIMEALSRFGSSLEGKQQAAKELGISLSSLYRYMKRFSI